jgi:Ca2+-binding RTX toxin-like protein
MAVWTAVEQLMLELVNRARLDPLGEAARLGIGLNDGLAPNTLNGKPMQVLAPDSALNDAASAHSLWMLATDTFSHTGSGGSSAGDRMTAAGYRFTGSWTWGENIAWQGTTGTVNAATYIVSEHESLFRSPGHRTNILNGTFSEIGVGAETGTYGSWNALMTTQAFAKSGTGVFVTGVCYTDRDRDGFYDIGEARAGIAVTASVGTTSGSDASAAAGGYAVEMIAGSARITFSGGGLPKAISAVVDTRAGNVKVDLVDGNRFEASSSMTLGADAVHGKLLGIATANLIGNKGNNGLTGNAGRNYLNGGDGNDTAKGAAGDDRVYGGNGTDQLFGDAGNDTLNGGNGIDNMTGGTGSDVFFFNTALAISNNDRIADFVAADDTIRLENAIFTTLATGALAASAYVVGSVATTVSHRIINYNGTLYFDPDGNGAARSTAFATLMGNPAASAADFEVV